MITRFECRSLYALLLIRLLHRTVKKDVRRYAGGYLGGTTYVQWRQRTLLSFSVWDSLGSIYDMGQVTRHVSAARIPGRLRAATACGIYSYRGDWRNVMFETPVDAGEEPIRPIGASPARPHHSSHADRRSQP
ncbi:hypothetical protein [Streptomyces cyslabdanicus]|uniref:hypothetical protein n=1 Tax=Streptomyces cyslabdanicus TaxID=1470456 RepID=UPI0040442FA8